MEQQQDQAAVAPSGNDAAKSAAPSAASSGIRIGVSSRPALPAADAASLPPEEQATLLGSLAPHVEPRAVRHAETDPVAAPASQPRAMAQPPRPPHPPQPAQPAGPQPASSAPPTPPLSSDAPAATPVPEASGAVAPTAGPNTPMPPPAADHSLSPPPSPVAAAPANAAVDERPVAPPRPPGWHAPAGRQPLPGYAPPAPARPPANVPWQAAESWGATTITIEANTAAGASYLFWWLSGLLIYFNERHNRFVRFHAMQSILLTGALTVFSVLALIVSALFGDVAQYARDPLIRHLFGTLGWGTLVMCGVIVLFVWVPAMVAAWAGNYLRLPIVGRYAERYSAPPIEPTQPPLY